MVRTTLALLVVLYHFLWSKVLGPYAVFGFYVISGFLMTLVMHESYGYDALGRRRFLANRALRLLPTYWVAVALSILLISWPGGQGISKHLHFAMTLPRDGASVFENALMMFPAWSPIGVSPRLVPDAWSLTVEVFYYFAICLGISRTLSRCFAWLAISLVYELLSVLFHAPWWARYMPLPAASLPFCLGALIYHAVRSPQLSGVVVKMREGATLWFVALLANGFFWGTLTAHAEPKGGYELGFFLNLALAVALTFSLASGGRPFRLSAPVDKFLGDLSYPIYLLQWQAAALATWLVLGSPQQLRIHAALSALTAWPLLIALLVGMAIAVVFLVDHPVQRLRVRLRPAKEATRPEDLVAVPEQDASLLSG